MSLEVVGGDECCRRAREETSAAGSSGCASFRSCLQMFVNTKDRKIFAVAYGIFVAALGIALGVGDFAIRATTATTVHTETPIPTSVAAATVILTGVLFSSLAFRKPRYLILATISSATISGIITVLGSMHHGTIVADRLTALSDCLYVTSQKLCTCTIESHSARISYSFRNTSSCRAITSHLLEVVYGMCGVYAVSFVACFGTTVYGVLLLHRNEVEKIKSEGHHSEIKKHLPEKKQVFEEPTPEVLVSGDKKKCVEPWQRDVATQTGDRSTGAESSCRHQCRHYVEVTDTRHDYVVNITKTRDPPPPYYETVYT